MNWWINNKGWYSNQGVSYIGDREGMRHTEGAIYLTNEGSYDGRGTYTLSGRMFKVFVTSTGVTVISISPKYE